jgi:hypothetical protein
MKLTKENYEMQMFDLLEGNLSPEEEHLVLQEIESDPFYSQEWKMFSETILEPETMVFAGKDALLQEEKAVIIPIRTRWQIFSYAAAVAAIFMGLFWFVQKSPDGEMVEGSTQNTPHIATELPGTNSSDAPEVQASTKHGFEVREEDLMVDKIAIEDDQPSNIKTSPARNMGDLVKQESVADQGKTDLDQETPQTPVIIPPIEDVLQDVVVDEGLDIDMDEPKEILVDLTPKNPILKDKNKNEVPSTVDNVLRPESELNAFQPAIAYTGLRAFMRRSAVTILRPFKNPKIKVARVEEENKPALNISFTSDAYYAAAIVHLR